MTPPFPEAGEARHAAEVDDLSTSQADPAVVHASSITLTHEWQPRSEGKPSLLKSEAEQPPPLSSPARDVMITEHARDVQRRSDGPRLLQGIGEGFVGAALTSIACCFQARTSASCRRCLGCAKNPQALSRSPSAARGMPIKARRRLTRRAWLFPARVGAATARNAVAESLSGFLGHRRGRCVHSRGRSRRP